MIPTSFRATQYIFTIYCFFTTCVLQLRNDISFGVTQSIRSIDNMNPTVVILRGSLLKFSWNRRKSTPFENTGDCSEYRLSTGFEEGKTLWGGVITLKFGVFEERRQVKYRAIPLSHPHASSCCLQQHMVHA